MQKALLNPFRHIAAGRLYAVIHRQERVFSDEARVRRAIRQRNNQASSGTFPTVLLDQ
jgi:hypothetical protein